ncbi:MAG: DMT family transporter [Anaerolineales bacterium]|nr:DMT family transporter [Chloroflexota bacterium]MBL6979698.1 DMT family transporter [Anaerolineales bacterium]
MKSQPAPNIILLGALFGTTLVASRFSVGQMSSLTYVGLRLSLAALGFIIIYLLPNNNRTWPRSKVLWQRGIILGIFGTALPMMSFVSSLQYISSGLAAVLMTTSPAITSILAHFLLPDEKLTLRRGTGVILAFIGALLLTTRGESGIAGLTRANPLGYVFVFSGILSANIMSIYIRKKMRDDNTFDIGVIRMISSAIVVIPLAWGVSGLDVSQVDKTGWTVLAYAAIIGTFFAMLLDFSNIKRFGATISSMVTFVIPVVAVICGAIFLGEQTTSSMLAGMLMIIAGVWLIIRN